MWDNPKSMPSVLIGLILLALGGIPLLSLMGIIAFTLPTFLTGIVSAIVLWLLAVGGLYLIIESFWEFDEPIGKVALLVGLIILAAGLIPLLQQFGIIGFGLPIGPILYNIIFVVEGILLIISAFNF